jgi:hypothetical protein
MGKPVAMYKGKLVMIAYGYDVDTDEQHEEVNALLNREWDWDQVHDWVYGDGDPGFGVNPTVGVDDPRVLRAVREIGDLMVHGIVGDFIEEIEGNDRIIIQWENKDTIVLFVNE